MADESNTPPVPVPFVNPKPREAVQTKEVALHLDLAAADKGVMPAFAFNWFRVEKIEAGCLVQLAWLGQGIDQVESLVLSLEGLAQVRNTAEEYVKEFRAEAGQPTGFPRAQIDAPQFCNFARFSRSGAWAEICFYLIPLSALASLSKAGKTEATVTPICITLAHSGTAIHEQLVLSMFSIL